MDLRELRGIVRIELTWDITLKSSDLGKGFRAGSSTVAIHMHTSEM
jgi:hypothetical protein